MLSKKDVTDLVYERKRQAGLSWASIAEGIGMSEVFTTSACLGMNALPRDKADLLVTNLGLPQEAAVTLAEYPTKVWDRSVPTDPCIYRFYEIVGVYGDTLKELVQEKCGNGIMSAIDFHMEVEKVPNPKGDRIEVRMSGKYLAYNAW
ncbi:MULTISPECIES: cyanase [Aureimonas]|jgi:cyanate lyase|uniref:Cyanate hydratase n=1 Tax=Aureimonas phyllosphaerae TaxID=1166078 RepID=A0A7W6BXF2_9HYPH|nr:MULTISPECIES: cyanase [Aureimonas]KQQ79047.1 cyanate hydratase [Aureimonas sp. Leaf324]MBB3936475.1 cyanate lyase [Aureimonas phyllosphaerae]MBB3960661.1 cyanate lyase [Aureimonas phyllosphaerae]SFF29734.1 cyanate lyase [Aureimonas phyllosphaerae]